MTSTTAMTTVERVAPRLKQRYLDEIKGELREQFSYANVMQIPGVVKVVVNMGVGDAARDAKLIDGAVRDLATITGQKPQVRRATKSIAQFKLREGMPIGAKVTLRGDRMWEFLDRLLTIALPRIRDFRGLSPTQFDGRGNYTFGLTEQSMFHEIDPDTQRVLVEGVNRIKKHTRITQNQRGAQSGGIITTEAAIHVSNVMLVDGDGKPTRVGKKVTDEGKRVRISRRSGKEI